MIKLNVGASQIWQKDGWHTLDHKFGDNVTSIKGDAVNIPLKNDTCSTVFSSHMFEHIPHVKLESILLEFNRVLEKNGVLRILTPDLKKLAVAYANDDLEFFKLAKEEDENMRTDLGLGGTFMNFIVAPGQDTALFNRSLDTFIAGYAHLYCYDFLMLKTLLERTGFNRIKHMGFCESVLDDYKEPLHVLGFKPEWNNLNQQFYEENNLIHYYNDVEGKYNINFKLTGFDRDPVTSLIIEAKKEKYIDKDSYVDMNNSKLNYNKYAFSLLKDKNFSDKLKKIKNIDN